jgi:hypothetical protein
MQVFLSYASANRVFAERLRDELKRLGLPLWWDEHELPGGEWSRFIEDGIRSASHLLLLIGPRDGEDEEQLLTRKVLLQAAWQDSRKRLIPILLKDAMLPAFVLSAFKISSMDGAELPVIRVRNLRDVATTAQAILTVIQRTEGGSAKQSAAGLMSPGQPRGRPGGAQADDNDPGSVDTGGGKAGLALSVEPSGGRAGLAPSAADSRKPLDGGARIVKDRVPHHKETRRPVQVRDFGPPLPRKADKGVSFETSAEADASSKAGYAERLDDIKELADKLKH